MQKIDHDSEDAPPADDRQEGEFPTDRLGDVQSTPGKRFRALRGGQVNAAALVEMWATRDEQYAALEHALTDIQIQYVRAFRLLEVRDLTPREQVGTDLATRALTWVPPR